MTNHVFGYGSLILPDSAAKGAGCTITQDDLLPCSLYGFRRAWCVREVVQLIDASIKKQLVDVVFLGLEVDRSTACVGVLVPVDYSRLAAYDAREKKYFRIDVTDGVNVRVEGRVWAYFPRPDAIDPQPTAMIPAKYEELLQNISTVWGEEFWQKFVASTRAEPRRPRMIGEYRFLDEEQNRAAER